MKVLQVNNVYAEKSTGVLTQMLHKQLQAAGHTSLVVYGRGEGAKETGVIRLCPDWYGKLNSLLSRITGMPYGGCLLSTWRLLRIIEQEKPDIVHLQCINGNFVNIYRLIRWLKKRKIRTVLSLHAEFLYTGNCPHAFSCQQWKEGCGRCPTCRHARRSWQAMRKAFAGFEEHAVLCPVSDWVRKRAEKAAIVKNIPMRTVWNAVDAPFCLDAQAVPEENVVLHVTARFSQRKDHPKGGGYVLELAKRMPQVTFWVAGAAEAMQNAPSNMRFLGQIHDRSELAERYRQAKLTLITSRAETFSLPCAESLCCGRAVVGFRAGGPEEIALPEHSEFVEFGNLDGLERTVRRWLEKKPDAAAVAREARQAYSPEEMTKQFLEVYRGLLCR